jgi:peptide-methionine (R)-S-oxide reductase
MMIRLSILVLLAGIVAGCRGDGASRAGDTAGDTAGARAAPPPAPSSVSTGDVAAGADPAVVAEGTTDMTKFEKSDADWRKQLSPEQYEVLRGKGTERPFSGKYWNTKTAGLYKCAGCGQELFVSDAKFDSGCGWPSFFQPATDHAIRENVDTSHGMVRTEVVCSRCGGHLGHVFEDGPRPTGLRYCINSASIDLVPKENEAGK